MLARTKRPPLTSLWAYAYLIVPPEPRSRLRDIRRIIRDENTAAAADARLWTGRLVIETLITYILIMSEGPRQTLGVNQRLEAELRRLEARFVVSTPMSIRGFPEWVAEPVETNGRHR